MFGCGVGYLRWAKVLQLGLFDAVLVVRFDTGDADAGGVHDHLLGPKARGPS